MATHDLDFAYRWLKTLCKKYPAIADPIGKAAWELTSFPALRERTDYNPVLYQLSLIASEFTDVPKVELVKLLQTYGSQDDVICSLLFRNGDPTIDFVGSRSRPYYLNFFSSNGTTVIKKYDQSEIDKLLVDSPDIPGSLFDALMSVLLYQMPFEDVTASQAVRPKTEILFSSIVSFCRNEMVDFEKLIIAGDRIGWPFYRQPMNAQLRGTVYLIKEIMLEQKGSRSEYEQALIQKITEQKDNDFSEIDEYFQELFRQETTFPVELLDVLFKAITNQSFLLRGDLLYNILSYVADKVEEKDFEFLGTVSANYTKSSLSQYEKDGHHNDFVTTLWMFGLISFYVDKKVQPHSRSAYLFGIEAIFIFDSGNNFINSNNRPMKFNGRDLLGHCLPIYEKINPNVLQEAIAFGMEHGTIEIKGICRVLKMFAANL